MRDSEVVKEFRIKYTSREQEQTGTVRLFLYKTSDECGIFYGFLEEDKLRRFNMVNQSLGITETYMPENKTTREDAQTKFFERVDKYLKAMGAVPVDDCGVL